MSRLSASDLRVLPGRGGPRTPEGVRCRLCDSPSLRVVGDEADRPRRLAHAINEAVDHYAESRRMERVRAIEALAKAVSVSARTLTRWTTGDAVPDLLQAVPLAKALGVHPLLFVEPPEVPVYPLSEYLVRTETADAVEQAIEQERRPRRRRAVGGESAA